MIIPCTGDMFKTNAEALVNPVNTVGVMGRGLALQFRDRYPELFAMYKRACNEGDMLIGTVQVLRTCTITGPRLVINFPTKRHWRDRSELWMIQGGLAALVTAVHHHKVKSIAIPALGCGLGGLSWEDVRPEIERAFTEFDVLRGVRVLLYGPGEGQYVPSR